MPISKICPEVRDRATLLALKCSFVVAMSPAEVTEKLGLHRMRDRSWYVHPRYVPHILLFSSLTRLTLSPAARLPERACSKGSSGSPRTSRSASNRRRVVYAFPIPSALPIPGHHVHAVKCLLCVTTPTTAYDHGWPTSFCTGFSPALLFCSPQISGLVVVHTIMDGGSTSRSLRIQASSGSRPVRLSPMYM